MGISPDFIVLLKKLNKLFVLVNVSLVPGPQPEAMGTTAFTCPPNYTTFTALLSRYRL